MLDLRSVRLAPQEGRDFELVVFVAHARLRLLLAAVIVELAATRGVEAGLGRQRAALLRGRCRYCFPGRGAGGSVPASAGGSVPASAGLGLRRIIACMSAVVPTAHHEKTIYYVIWLRFKWYSAISKRPAKRMPVRMRCHVSSAAWTTSRRASCSN